MFVCRLNKKVTIWSHLPSPFFPHSKKFFFITQKEESYKKLPKKKHNSFQKFTEDFFPFSASISVTTCSYVGGGHPGWWDGRNPARPYFPGEDSVLAEDREGLCEAVQLWRNPNAAQIITQHLTTLPLSPLGVLTAPTADESPPRGQAHVGKGARRPFAPSLGAWLAWPFGFPVVDSSLLPCRLGGRLSQVWMDGRECAGPPGGGP